MLESITNLFLTHPIWSWSSVVILVVILVWVVILALRRKEDFVRMTDMVFLQVHIPKKENRDDREQESESFSSGKDFKEVLGVMNHFFESLYSLYSTEFAALWHGQDYLSFEYVVREGRFCFYIVVPDGLAALVEKQVTSFYPDAFVTREGDYGFLQARSKVAGCYLFTKRKCALPIKTYDRQNSDPLNVVSNTLSKLEPEDGAIIQLMVRPYKDGWQKKGQRLAESIMQNKSEEGFGSRLNPLHIIQTFFEAFMGEKSEKPELERQRPLSPLLEEKAKAVEEKANEVGFEVVIRLLAVSPSLNTAKQTLIGMRGAFQQFGAPNLNAFGHTKYHSLHALVRGLLFRKFSQNLWHQFFGKKMIFSPKELASIWHIPSSRYNKAPNIAWQRFKIAEAPDNISQNEGIFLGYNVYRGGRRKICIKNNDRFRHFYVIGQTGTGKSSVLQTMAHQDFAQGHGMAIIDPHGQLIEDLLPHIPRERADDIIYFNPADTTRPMGLNLLEGKTEEERDLISLDAMNIMIKLFGEEIFGPRIQDYFRNGCLTLMEDPDGGALTDIVRLFTDDMYQQYKVSKVKNPIVRSFWENQMAKTSAKDKAEMIPYFAAKFGAFITNSMMRNIVGQVHSAFDIADVMQEGKILLINLSKGLLGDINSKLLGLIIVNKIQVAALRRQRMAASERKDFFLYIDEFQNYITNSIESILSEARKYRLGLVLAHQYIDQLVDEKGNEQIKKAVFGNVGTMMAYKIGAQDGEFMAQEMAPVFADQDLLNLDAFQAAIKLSVDSQPSRPFSLSVQKPWDPEWAKKYPRDDEAAEIYKEISRLKYGRDKEFVGREIERRIGAFS